MVCSVSSAWGIYRVWCRWKGMELDDNEWAAHLLCDGVSQRLVLPLQRTQRLLLATTGGLKRDGKAREEDGKSREGRGNVSDVHDR